MTVRTFQQYGQGFGSEPVGLIAKINGVVVFEGTTTALDEPLPLQPDVADDFHSVLFSWENTVDFAGTAEMEITITGPGTVILTKTVANYTLANNNNPPLGPDSFLPFYHYTEEGQTVIDPMSNPQVNGLAIARDRDPETESPLTGQWWYTLPTGAVFTATVNVLAGKDPAAI